MAAAELAHWAASRSGLGAASGPPDVVLVLGFPSRADGSPHPRQRWRARLAAANPGTLVFSGGPHRGGPSEAAGMAALARGLGVAEDRIVLEETARTTWENVARSIPLLEGAARIAIVSDSLHALRARHYLAEQRPDLAARLVSGGDYSPGDHWWLKPKLAAYEALVRLDGVKPPRRWQHVLALLAMSGRGPSATR